MGRACKLQSLVVCGFKIVIRKGALIEGISFGEPASGVTTVVVASSDRIYTRHVKFGRNLYGRVLEPIKFGISQVLKL